MAMTIDYTLPLFNLIQNYMLNVTLMAANECFKPLLNDYTVNTDRGEVLITGTHDKIPLNITLKTSMGNQVAYYKVRVTVKWVEDPNHSPFDMVLESHMLQHPIKDFDEIRNTFVAALAAKDVP